MTSQFDQNWGFASKWSTALSQVIQGNVDVIASVKAAASIADKKTCADFIVTTSNGNTVAARIRRGDILYRDFTLRAKANGARTELEKIRDGYGDWFLYAWTDDMSITDWILVDLNRMRRSGLLEADRKIIANTDGETAFVAFTRKELRQADCLARQMKHEPTYKDCGYGNHKWEDVVDGNRKCVRCVKCDKYWGDYPSVSSPSALGFVKG